MTVVVLMAAFSFAVIGCAGPQAEEVGATGRENAEAPAREVKASRADVVTIYRRLRALVVNDCRHRRDTSRRCFLVCKGATS